MSRPRSLVFLIISEISSLSPDFEMSKVLASWIKGRYAAHAFGYTEIRDTVTSIRRPTKAVLLDMISCVPLHLGLESA